MNQPKTARMTPRRFVILLSVILGVLHVILLGWTVQRKTASAQLLEDKQVLEQNLNQLQQINQDELDDLQDELDQIEGEIALLENSFPDLGTSFAMYRRGMDLARESQVELVEISLNSSETLETVSGLVLKNQYNIETRGSLANCLTFIDNLENAGLDTISLEFASIIPEEERCSLEVNTLGYPSQSDQ